MRVGVRVAVRVLVGVSVGVSGGETNTQLPSTHWVPPGQSQSARQLGPQLPKKQPTQVPVLSHSSRLVRGLPSSHAEQAGKRVCEHPTAGLHRSVVHELPSLQSPPVWMQTNKTHESVVHLLLSLQSASLRHCAEAARAAHRSSAPSRASRAARAADERPCDRPRRVQPPLAALAHMVFMFVSGTGTKAADHEQAMQPVRRVEVVGPRQVIRRARLPQPEVRFFSSSS